MSWYLEVLRQYAQFGGRARRKEYWFFVLFNVLFAFAFGLVDVGLGLWDQASGIGVLSGLYSLAVLLPGLAVSVRRLHDTGRSGWWLLIGLIPVIGALVLFVFFVLDGDAGENEYGPDPKAGARPGDVAVA